MRIYISRDSIGSFVPSYIGKANVFNVEFLDETQNECLGTKPRIFLLTSSFDVKYEKRGD